MFKTNVMRILDRAKIPYESFSYSETLTEGVLIAGALGQDSRKVFKTLVRGGGAGQLYVFGNAAAETPDRRAGGRAAGTKSVSMLKQKELLPLTGYIHGGCSPVGMKKPFKTVIDSSALNLEEFCVSAGKVGYQVKLSPKALAEFIGAGFADITVKTDSQ